MFKLTKQFKYSDLNKNIHNKNNNQSCKQYNKNITPNLFVSIEFKNKNGESEMFCYSMKNANNDKMIEITNEIDKLFE